MEDAVYYNQTMSQCGAISHTGDSRDGTADGYDEIVTIDFKSVKNSVSYLAILISSYKGVGFKNIETASISIMQAEDKLLEIPLGGIRSKDNSLLAFVIYRNGGTWTLLNTNTFGPGKVFTECQDLINGGLVNCGLDMALIQESKSWAQNRGKKFILEKE
jgi:tellurium resistance protein TerD